MNNIQVYLRCVWINILVDNIFVSFDVRINERLLVEIFRLEFQLCRINQYTREMISCMSVCVIREILYRIVTQPQTTGPIQNRANAHGWTSWCPIRSFTLLDDLHSYRLFVMITQLPHCSYGLTCIYHAETSSQNHVHI